MKLTVVVLIDALGWEIVEHFAFCRDLLPYSRPLGTVLGYSSGAIPSLLSGAPPASHGAWAMYRYAPQQSPFKIFRYLPSLPHALEWRARVLTKRVLARRKTIRGYYDLYEIPLKLLGHFDVAEHGDPYTPGGLGEETLFDRFVADGVPYSLWTYRTPEARNFDELRGRVDSGDRVLFLYTAELDALMHRVGIFHDEVGAKLGEYERQLRAVLDAAQSAGREVDLYLFSDHGMTDVTEVVDVMAAVKSWGYTVGRDLVAFFDSTMARFWCDGDTARELAHKIDATGWGHTLSAAELGALGCGFEDNAYGDVIFLVSPGRLIVPSFMSDRPVAAMHGYHPEDRYSIGCFMTNTSDRGMPASILDIKRYLLARTQEDIDG